MGGLIFFLAFTVSVLSFSAQSQTDPLASWNLVYQAPVPINSMAYGNGTFVGLGGSLRFLSHDGSNWMVYSSPPTLQPASVIFGNDIFITFGTNSQSGGSTYLYQSTNGLSYSPIFTNANSFFAAAGGNNIFVFIQTNDILTATIGPTNWSWSEYQPAFEPACIGFANGTFVMVANLNGASVFTSSDGILWQYTSTIPTIFTHNGTLSPTVNGIAYGNGVYVLDIQDTSSNSPFACFGASPDLVSWDYPSIVGLDGTNLQLAFGGGSFLVNGYTDNGRFVGDYLFSSGNGREWNVESTNFNETGFVFNPMTYGQGLFVGVSSNYSICQSGLVATPSNLPPVSLAISPFAGITLNGTVGLTYQIQYSGGLNSNWTAITNFSLPYSPYLWIDTSTPMVGQRFYRSIQLQ